MKWNSEEEGLLLVLYDEGMTNAEIASVLNDAFNNGRSNTVVGTKIYNLTEKFGLAKRKDFIKPKSVKKVNANKALISIKPEVKTPVEIKPILEPAKVNKTPILTTSAIKLEANRMKIINKRHNKGYTVAEDIVIITHYGVSSDEELANHLGRTMAGVKYRYGKITKDRTYVGQLVEAGIQNPNINVIPDELNIQVIPKIGWFKRWKLRRLAKRTAKTQLKALKLKRQLKQLEG